MKKLLRQGCVSIPRTDHEIGQKQTAKCFVSSSFFLLVFFLLGASLTVFAQDSHAQTSQVQPPAAQSGGSDDYSTPAENGPGELQPTYPGEPMNKPPVETTIGPVKLRAYGTVLLN